MNEVKHYIYPCDDGVMNYYKIVKTGFIITIWTVMLSTDANIQSHIGVLPVVKGLRHYYVIRLITLTSTREFILQIFSVKSKINASWILDVS